MSKKITSDSIKALLDGVPFKRGNTEVVREGSIYYLKLFGNKIIARKGDGRIWISNAGWFSNTTKERLNGLPIVQITQKDWGWFLNGMAWDGKPISVGII
jgi:hypothetical protein